MEYNKHMSAVDQIEMEEFIASLLFDDSEVEISEEAAAGLGRTILRAVLLKFRPDLFVGTSLRR